MSMSKRKRQCDQPAGLAPGERSGSSFSSPQLVHGSDNYSIEQRSLSVGQVLASDCVAPAPKSADSVRNDAGQNTVKKFTACDGCRKQKIRCDMPNDEPPCTRCHRRSLPCVQNKNMHALLEDSKKSDDALRADVASLYQTLGLVCQRLNLEAPRPLQSRNDSTAPAGDGRATQSSEEPDCEVSPPDSPSAVQAPIDTFMEVVKLTSPGSGDVSTSSKRQSSQQDLVTKGIISSQVADRLLDRYFTRLDHYVYGIASMYKDPAAARQASPVLFAAICTVSALHERDTDQAIYEACNREFRRLVARSLFEKRDIEYIRALCIASFWLSDAARIFSSDAIRRAGDMRLHRFFKRAVYPTKAKGSNDEHTSLSSAQITDRVRLWYLLFVCDQHMSILHNRDSLLRSDREITTDWEAFLEREGREDNDVRILSQTSLLLIMGQVRDSLGGRGDEKLPVSAQGQLMMFSRQFDKWFNRFSAIFKPNPHIGGFPAKGLRLHYHFGKLNLGHHVFQGLHGEPIPLVFVSTGLMAHDAATAIFELILSDEQLQGDLVGMPHYFHIMIAFAGHFLLEICHKYHAQLSLDLYSDLNLINRVLFLFESMASHPQHPIRRMTPGLGQKLFGCAAGLSVELDARNGVTSTFAAPAVPNRGTEHLQYPALAETWQFVPAQMDTMDEMALANFGGFEISNMAYQYHGLGEP